MNDPNQPPPLPPPLPEPRPHPVEPLAYGGPAPLITTREAGSAALRFLAGLVAGAALSLVVWGLGWYALFDGRTDAGAPAIFLVPGIISLVLPGGLNPGIDFTSGTIMTIQFDNPVDSDQLVLANPLANRPDAKPDFEATSR